VVRRAAGCGPSEPGPRAQAAGREARRADDRLEQRESARPRQNGARRRAERVLAHGAQPGRYSGGAGPLIEALAKLHGVTPQNIVLGCGSTQILRSATHLFTARTKALVGTIPTYEECAGYADMMGHPVRAIPLDREFNVDLDRVMDAARGAGLVFFCNPNNPVATYVGARTSRDFIARVNRISPETTILVDEATSVRHRRSRRTFRRPSRIRASWWRARSRRRTAWPASASATRSGTLTRFAR
jgi:histidinol-phosphate/aromatic aminotransferase/cobyric acid decarboxylase-like protein